MAGSCEAVLETDEKRRLHQHSRLRECEKARTELQVRAVIADADHRSEVSGFSSLAKLCASRTMRARLWPSSRRPQGGLLMEEEQFCFRQFRLQRIERLQRLARRHLVGVRLFHRFEQLFGRARRRRLGRAPRTVAGRRPAHARSGRGLAPRVWPAPIWPARSPAAAGPRVLPPADAIGAVGRGARQRLV